MHLHGSVPDKTIKYWLGLLAVAIVISFLLIARSFLQVLALPQEKDTVDPVASRTPEQIHTSTPMNLQKPVDAYDGSR